MKHLLRDRFENYSKYQIPKFILNGYENWQSLRLLNLVLSHGASDPLSMSSLAIWPLLWWRKPACRFGCTGVFLPSRLARETLPDSVVLAGPSYEALQGQQEIFGEGSDMLVDDQLSEDDLAFICGTYVVETGIKSMHDYSECWNNLTYSSPGQTAIYSWFPRAHIWEGSGLNVGFWNQECERWYLKHRSKILDGTAVSLSGRDWRQEIRKARRAPQLSIKMTMLLLNSSNRRKEILLHFPIRSRCWQFLCLWTQWLGRWWKYRIHTPLLAIINQLHCLRSDYPFIESHWSLFTLVAFGLYINVFFTLLIKSFRLFYLLVCKRNWRNRRLARSLLQDFKIPSAESPFPGWNQLMCQCQLNQSNIE